MKMLLLAAMLAADGQPVEQANRPRVGVLGGAGFPQPLSVEVLAKPTRHFAFGAEYGALPTVSVGGIDMRSSTIAADFRFFPFGNAFFLGARAGRRHVEADASLTAYAQTFTGRTTVDTWFVNPRFGLLRTMGPGITVGIDVGLHIPLGRTRSTEMSHPGIPVPETITTLAELGSKGVLPTVTLLQLGFLF